MTSVVYSGPVIRVRRSPAARKSAQRNRRQGVPGSGAGASLGGSSGGGSGTKSTDCVLGPPSSAGSKRPVEESPPTRRRAAAPPASPVGRRRCRCRNRARGRLGDGLSRSRRAPPPPSARAPSNKAPVGARHTARQVGVVDLLEPEVNGAGIVQGAVGIDGAHPEQLEALRQGPGRRPAEEVLGAEENEDVAGARHRDRPRFQRPRQERARQPQEGRSRRALRAMSPRAARRPSSSVPSPRWRAAVRR